MPRVLKSFYLFIGAIPILWLAHIFTNYLRVFFTTGHFPEYLSGLNASILTSPISPHSPVMTAVLHCLFWGVVVIPVLITIHFILSFKMKFLGRLSIKYVLLSYTDYVACFTLAIIPRTPVRSMLMYFID